jgi:predicted deacylase
VGVHPNESKSHNALYEALKAEDKSLNKCYYIYKVNVTSDANIYSDGRMNGQLLAQEFVVPDIKKEKFDLVIDVHSNVGNWAENRFIFSPVTGSSAEKIAYQIRDQLPWLTYYVPPNPTSPAYVTTPLIEAGIPAVIYETYVQDSYELMRQHASELIKVVDKLQL